MGNFKFDADLKDFEVFLILATRYNIWILNRMQLFIYCKNFLNIPMKYSALIHIYIYRIVVYLYGISFVSANIQPLILRAHLICLNNSFRLIKLGLKI